MTIVNIPQKGKDWLDWRGKGLGASDAAAVLGISPWTSPFELWCYKTELCRPPDFHPNAIAAMNRGTELEPVARALASKQLDIDFSNTPSGEHDVHSFIRASLDGLSPDGKVLLEIKCPGKVDHAMAMQGKVPPKYYAQIQQQFLVSGAERGYYFSWDGSSDKGVAIEVFPNAEYIAILLTSLQAFWSRVEMRMPPTPTAKDLARCVDRLTTDIARVQNSINTLNVLGGAL